MNAMSEARAQTAGTGAGWSAECAAGLWLKRGPDWTAPIGDDHSCTPLPLQSTQLHDLQRHRNSLQIAMFDFHDTISCPQEK